MSTCANKHVVENASNNFIMHQHPSAKTSSERRLRYLILAIAWTVFSTLGPGSATFGQTLTEPHKERTLNGLQVLISPNAAASDVFLKLRIHSGAAFDLNGKAGTMALLSDILFGPTTREYVSDELGGTLKTETDYDAIEVTLSGKPQNFERLIELLRTALVSTPLDKETIERVKAEKERALKAASPSATDQADAAIRTRLYGDFPYGKPVGGTLDSLGRIDRADLMFARERFLNPNNATLVVAGNVQSDRVMRTLRQLLGGWRKSDNIVPSTFRQPSAPDERLLVIEPANGENVEVRYAVRGVSRGTREELSAQALATILQNRLKSRGPAIYVVKSEANLLPGAVIISTSIPYSGLKPALSSIRSEVASLSKTAPSATEVSSAIAAIRASVEGQSIDQVTDRWLDSITYKAPDFRERLAQLDQLTPLEIQALASRLFSSTPALVAVGDGNSIVKELGVSEKIQRSVAATSVPSAVNPK